MGVHSMVPRRPSLGLGPTEVAAAADDAVVRLDAAAADAVAASTKQIRLLRRASWLVFYSWKTEIPAVDSKNVFSGC